MKNKSWFTLVELMVVIAMIGILSSALFPSLSRYISRSRDSTRLVHLNTIDKALTAYEIDKDTYPKITQWDNPHWKNLSIMEYLFPKAYSAMFFTPGEPDEYHCVSRINDPVFLSSLPQPPIDPQKISAFPCAYTSIPGSYGFFTGTLSTWKVWFFLVSYVENPGSANLTDLELSFYSIPDFWWYDSMSDDLKNAKKWSVELWLLTDTSIRPIYVKYHQ